ncbi:hypothetical protein BBJ28_00016084 [Nothophytophthora sp. Chile5]|nr:hypothetical protein BBJ28_00016084 [Nothophytophthora sp. Chile5]
MSFLPPDDLEPTLVDVLAFIDAFDGSASGSSTATTSRSSESSTERDVVCNRSEAPPVDKEKAKKSAAVRRSQHKKRADLLALRAQVTALAARLTQLTEWREAAAPLPETPTGSDQKGNDSECEWRSQALAERQLRRDSEARNRQLKTILERQEGFATALTCLLRQATTLADLAEISRPPSPITPSLLGPVPSFEDAIVGELAAKMGQMYVASSSMFVKTDVENLEGFSSKMDYKRDSASGVPYIEMRTALPLDLGLPEAGKALQETMTALYTRHVSPQSLFRYISRTVSELGIQKRVGVEFRDQANAVDMNVRGLSRFYEEAQRFVWTFSVFAFQHPNDDTLRFQEQGWFLVTSSSSDPLKRSILQSCYHVAPVTPSIAGSNRGAEATRAFVLQCLSSSMQSGMRDIHDNVLKSVKPAAADRL